MSKYKKGQLGMFGGNQLMLSNMPEEERGDGEAVAHTVVDLRGRNATSFELKIGELSSGRLVYADALETLVAVPADKQVDVRIDCYSRDGILLATHDAKQWLAVMRTAREYPIPAPPKSEWERLGITQWPPSDISRSKSDDGSPFFASLDMNK